MTLLLKQREYQEKYSNDFYFYLITFYINPFFFFKKKIWQVSVLNQIIQCIKMSAGQINLKMLFAPSTIGVVCS